MSSCFYMGTRYQLLEIPAPAASLPSSKVGYSNVVTFLNGGASARQSVASHKTYTMTWNLLARDEARLITDLADGIYGTGPIYIHDPIASDRNVLPQWWATPSQGIYDGLPLNAASRGVAIATPTNVLGFPSESIEYDVQFGATRNVWIPIPPNHTAWVGAYGQDGTGGEMIATPTSGPDNSGDGPPDTLTLLDVTDNARFNESYSYPTWTGVKLSMGGAGTITLSGLMVQVLPTGVTPETGGFISGQGNSGLIFNGQPQFTPYSAALDKVGVVAEFVETAGWDE